MCKIIYSVQDYTCLVSLCSWFMEAFSKMYDFEQAQYILLLELWCLFVPEFAPKKRITDTCEGHTWQGNVAWVPKAQKTKSSRPEEPPARILTIYIFSILVFKHTLREWRSWLWRVKVDHLDICRLCQFCVYNAQVHRVNHRVDEKRKPLVSTFQDVFSGQNVLEPIVNVNQKPGQERRWQTRIGSSRCV